MERPEIDRQIQFLTYKKDDIVVQWGKDGLFKKQCWINWISIQEKIFLMCTQGTQKSASYELKI